MANAFELSFGGKPFVLPSADVRAFVDRFCRLDNLPPAPEPKEWDGFFPPAPPPPRPCLNEFFYPWGARRWATFRGLMHADDVSALTAPTGTTPADVPVATYSSGFGYQPRAATFVAQTGDATQQISTSLFMLPPQPLAGLSDPAVSTTQAGADHPSLYLITLVDERYFWRWTGCSLRSTIHTSRNTYDWDYTWTTLFNQLAASAGITLTTGAIDQAYGYPDPSSPFQCVDQPVPLLLDAACAHTGRVLCRNWDGTYVAQKYTDALTAAEQQRATVYRIGGGLAFTTSQAHESTAANSKVPPALNRPRYVNVTTGTYDTKAGTHAVRDLNIPRDDRTDFLDASTEQKDGNTYLKGFVQGRLASIRQKGTRPPNDPNDPTRRVNDRLMKDWYDWNARNLTESYRGVVKFDPKAGMDVCYCYDDPPLTFVAFDGFSYEWRYFWHHDGVVVNDWPRQVKLRVDTVDQSTGEGRGRILYDSDSGESGQEWPDIRIASHAPSILNRGEKWLALHPGMVLPATFSKAEDPDPPGSAPTATYIPEGVHQRRGYPSGSVNDVPLIGDVWIGDQHMGQGIKHVGALSLTRLADPFLTPPSYVPAGFIPAQPGGNSPGLQIPGFTFNQAGSAICAVGGFDGDGLGFSTGGFGGAFQFPAAHLVCTSTTLTTQAGLSGGTGWNTSSGQQFGAAGPLVSQGFGGPNGNDGLLGHGSGADQFVWVPVPNTAPRGTAQFGSNMPFFPESAFTPHVTNIQHPMGGRGQSIAGYLAVGGGLRVPLTGFGQTIQAPPIPGSTGFAWAEGESGYVPTVPQQQHSWQFVQPIGQPGEWRLFPGYQEKYGYPPDPMGPMLFCNGLYVGGGGNLVTATQLSDAMHTGALAAAASITLESLTGGGARIHTPGQVEMHTGLNLWSYESTVQL